MTPGAAWAGGKASLTQMSPLCLNNHAVTMPAWSCRRCQSWASVAASLPSECRELYPWHRQESHLPACLMPRACLGFFREQFCCGTSLLNHCRAVGHGAKLEPWFCSGCPSCARCWLRGRSVGFSGCAMNAEVTVSGHCGGRFASRDGSGCPVSSSCARRADLCEEEL